MLQKLCDDIHALIIQANSKNNLEALPNSDQFIRETSSILTIDNHLVRRVINILRESHKILSLEVVQEDKNKDIKKIECYVDTDLKTIKRLKIIFQNVLMDEYEHEHGRRLMTHQIIKDIYNRISVYKNTPLGQLANKAIMLEEFEYLIEKNYKEYSDAWKSKKLAEILNQTENVLSETDDPGSDKPAAGPSAAATVPANMRTIPENKRAIDTEQYAEIAQSVTPQSINKMIQIYGINFFYRVQLRKYNFSQLRNIIEGGIIQKREDLKLLKDMIKTVRKNVQNDLELEKYMDELNGLDQTITHYILYVRQ